MAKGAKVVGGVNKPLAKPSQKGMGKNWPMKSLTKKGK